MKMEFVVEDKAALLAKIEKPSLRNVELGNRYFHFTVYERLKTRSPRGQGFDLRMGSKARK